MKRNLDFILRSNVEPKKMIAGAVSFINGDTVDYTENGRDGHILHIILNGEREYVFDGERQILGPHSVIFIPDGTKYVSTGISKNGELCEGINVKFWFDGDFERNIPCGIYVHQSHASSSLERDFYRLVDVFEKEPTFILKQKKVFFDVFVRFIEKCSSTDGITEAVSPAIEYISAHYKQNEPVARYAAVCNMSESYFRKNFQLATGVSPIAYRNILRFVEAKRLYREGHTMKAIAEELGFCDENYLSKLYKRENGTNLKDDAGLV